MACCNTVCLTKLWILIVLHLFEMPPILESPVQPFHFVCLFVCNILLYLEQLSVFAWFVLKRVIEVLGDQNDCALRNEQLALALRVGIKTKM